MAGLQRSVETFRRSGSSGLVWEDRFLTDELKRKEEEAAADKNGGELSRSRSVGSKHSSAAVAMERSRSHGGGNRGFRASGRVSPALDPPSPRLHGCGFCGIFGKHETVKKATERGSYHRQPLA